MIFTKEGSPYKKEKYFYGTYYIEDNDVVFEDCDFRNCKIIEPFNKVRGLQNLTFKNCIFDNTEIAVHCTKSDFSTCLIINSHITDCRTIISSSGNKFPEPPELCPKRGKFIAYKLLTLFPNVHHYKEFRDLYLISCGQELQDIPFIMGTLEIPDNALRVNGYGEKCRSSAATLIDAKPLFYDVDEKIKNVWDKLNNLVNNPDVFNELFHYGSPLSQSPIEYEIGIPNIVINYDDNYLYECAGGIHFYMDEQYVTELGCGIFRHREVMTSFPPICSGLNILVDHIDYTDLYRERITHILEKLVEYVKTVFEINRENV